mmetsp:Transcript_180072/g.571452  ORF Transcript_180072/g.571452 Transcript_180072/m.571452 type:complete len:86 (-) Transcript_180072:18-275(-)
MRIQANAPQWARSGKRYGLSINCSQRAEPSHEEAFRSHCDFFHALDNAARAIADRVALSPAIPRPEACLKDAGLEEPCFEKAGLE